MTDKVTELNPFAKQRDIDPYFTSGGDSGDGGADTMSSYEKFLAEQ